MKFISKNLACMCNNKRFELQSAVKISSTFLWPLYGLNTQFCELSFKTQYWKNFHFVSQNVKKMKIMSEIKMYFFYDN